MERSVAGRWEELYGAHFAYVYRLMFALNVEPAESEDLTQRVFLIAHEKLRQEDELEHPRAWLRAIALRVVADHRRWRGVRQVKRWLVKASHDAATPAPKTPEQDSAAAQAQQQVRAALAEMSPKLRDVLVLLEIEECSLQETAELLGIPANTVRSRKRLAREQFAGIWRARSGAACDHG